VNRRTAEPSKHTCRLAGEKAQWVTGTITMAFVIKKEARLRSSSCGFSYVGRFRHPVSQLTTRVLMAWIDAPFSPKGGNN
jgi:hypothetical protein